LRTSNGLLTNTAEIELQSPDCPKKFILIFMTTSLRKTWKLEGRSHIEDLILSKESWLTQQSENDNRSNWNWSYSTEKA
jgi:hypothetical protein